MADIEGVDEIADIKPGTLRTVERGPQGSMTPSVQWALAMRGMTSRELNRSWVSGSSVAQALKALR